MNMNLDNDFHFVASMDQCPPEQYMSLNDKMYLAVLETLANRVCDLKPEGASEVYISHQHRVRCLDFLNS